jgi:protein ImuB
MGNAGVTADMPLLLWHEDPRRGRQVMAACDICQRLAIYPHMPLHEAVELARRAAAIDATNQKALSVQVERYNPQADRQALGRLADALLLEISPLVAIEPEPERAPWAGLHHRHSEMLLVNITGIGDWFGSEQAILEATQRLLQRLGLQATMAIADTSAAAWGLARFNDRNGVTRNDATDRDAASDCNATLIAPGQMAEAVDPLPVHSLRITAEVAHQLDRLGIKTVGQLRRLPRSGLATRLGNELVRRMDQMLGRREEPLVMHHSEPEDAVTCELEYPTTDLEILSHRIGLLIDTVAERLATRVRGALRLSCQLDILENHPPRRIDVGLFAPTADAEHLRRLMMTSLEGKQLPAMVQRVSVAVDLAGPLRQFQATLFGEESPSDAAARRSLARMIETVAMRLGRDAVLEVLASDHPLPESAYSLRPLAGQTDRPSNDGGGSAKRSGSAGRRNTHAIKSPRRSLLPAPLGPLPSDPLRRPLRLFVHPPRIAVVISAAAGVLTHLRISGRPSDSPPSHSVASRSYRVLQCRGPERIEAAAAAGGAIRRDYYRVEIEGGVWFWLFRQWGSGRAETWHLHGRFD